MDENKTEWIEPRHCTAYYDVSGGNVNYANEVQNALGMEFNIATTELWIGQEGIGLEVEFTQQQCDLMSPSMNIMPHVTLIVAKGHRAKEIGPMIARLKGLSRQYVCQVWGRNLSHEKKQREREHTDSMAIFERINVTVETNVINGGKKRTCWHKYPMNYGRHIQMR